MNDELKKNLLNIEALKRFALMVLFVLIFTVVELVVYAVAIFQLLHLLFMGSIHAELKKFAGSLSLFVFDITKYLTFDSEELPFPFKPWNTDENQEAKEKQADATKKDDADEDEIHA